MDAKRFLKWASCLAAVVVGMIYLASALLVSEKVASLFDVRTTRDHSFKMVEDAAGKNASKSSTMSDAAKDNPQKEEKADNGGTSETKTGVNQRPVASTGVPRYLLVQVLNTESSFAGVLPTLVRLVLLTAFLLAPIAIFYVFLIRPLRDIPLVEPDAIAALDDDNPHRRKEAGVVVAEAMWSASSCTDDDRSLLRKALERPSDIDRVVRDLLFARETAARQKAVEIATMAGLTMAASSSTIGDGLGMFFWKSKLVYETFRIYGFRPDARTTVSIWAHVVFASLLAASVEELCELFDVSELFGGIGTRVVQGTVGAAVVLKGGQLARAYLTGGISAESRHHALDEFKKSAKDDLGSVVSTVGESLSKIGLGELSS